MLDNDPFPLLMKLREVLQALEGCRNSLESFSEPDMSLEFKTSTLAEVDLLRQGMLLMMDRIVQRKITLNPDGDWLTYSLSTRDSTQSPEG